MSKCVKSPLNQIPGFLYQPLFPTLSLPFSEIQKSSKKIAKCLLYAKTRKVPAFQGSPKLFPG